MQCDVRKCPIEEVVPLFNKLSSSKPTDVKWDSEDCFVRFESGKARISYWMRIGNGEGLPSVSFEFYPGIDNIRFDGWLRDEESLKKLVSFIEYGRGQKVSDFFKLN